MTATCVSIIATIAAGLCFAATPQSDPAEDFATSAYDEAGSGKHWLLSLTVVQAELALSADQVVKLLPWLEQAEKSYFGEDSSPADGAEELQVEALLKEILSEAQQRRLGEIILQSTYLEPMASPIGEMDVHHRLNLAVELTEWQIIHALTEQVDASRDALALMDPVTDRWSELTTNQLRHELRACYPRMRMVLRDARRRIRRCILTRSQCEAIAKVFGKRFDVDSIWEEQWDRYEWAEPGVGADSR